MKNLNLSPSINIGGHRLSVDDLFIAQESINNVAKLVAELLGEVPAGGLILAGADQYTNTGTNFSINAGWLYYGGAVWRIVPVSTTPIVPPNTGALYFKLNKAPINPPVVYQSGAQYQVHVENQALLEWHSATPLGNYIPVSNISFDNIKNAFAPLQSAWQSIPNVQLTTYLRPDNDALKLDTANSFFRYKVVGKTVFVQAKVQANTSVTAFYIYLPAVIAPAGTELPIIQVWDTQADFLTEKHPALILQTSPVKYFKATRSGYTGSGSISFQTFYELA